METVAQIPKYNLNEEEEKTHPREYRSLLKVIKSKLKPGDKALVRTAFEMSAEAHKTMRRKSGEPYILHPIAVAKICAEEIGLGIGSTICALLHDTVEDTTFHSMILKENLAKRSPGLLTDLPKLPTSLM